MFITTTATETRTLEALQPLTEMSDITAALASFDHLVASIDGAQVRSAPTAFAPLTAMNMFAAAA